MAILRLRSQVSVPSNPASDSDIANNTVLNALMTACAPIFCALSNLNKADQEVLGAQIIDV